MSILNVEHLTHGFGDRAIFNDVSFRLLKGEHIGLVGANGEGKSTFFNIVTGKLMPDEGKIEWAKNVRVGYLDQHSVLSQGMSIRDVLKSAFSYLFEMEERMNGICDSLGTASPEEMDTLMEELGTIQDTLTMHDFYVIDAKVEEVARALGLLDIGLERDVTDLSGGQRTKVLLGKLLLEKPDILLLDEPTNYLDEEHIEWLIDALLLLNLEIGDPRIELMKNNPQMPCLALADSSLTSGLPTLMSDDAAASGTMIRHLALFGHKNIARVAGPEELGHSYIRDAAFSEITTELGMRYRCLHTDYTPESGAEATKRLLSVEPRPTAIIYDNDVMALAGESVASVKGVRVPEDLSIISWGDSFMNVAAHPPITALSRNILESGRLAAQLMLKLIDGEDVENVEEPPYELIERASTAPAAQ